MHVYVSVHFTVRSYAIRSGVYVHELCVHCTAHYTYVCTCTCEMYDHTLSLPLDDAQTL